MSLKSQEIYVLENRLQNVKEKFSQCLKNVSNSLTKATSTSQFRFALCQKSMSMQSSKRPTFLPCCQTARSRTEEDRCLRVSQFVIFFHRAPFPNMQELCTAISGGWQKKAQPHSSLCSPLHARHASLFSRGVVQAMRWCRQVLCGGFCCC